MVGITVEVSFQRMKSHRGVGGRGRYFQFSIMAYTRRLEVYEREGILPVEVHRRVGKSVYILYFRSVKWPKQMLTHAFYGCEKFQNTLQQLFSLCLFFSVLFRGICYIISHSIIHSGAPNGNFRKITVRKTI